MEPAPQAPPIHGLLPLHHSGARRRPGTDLATDGNTTAAVVGFGEVTVPERGTWVAHRMRFVEATVLAGARDVRVRLERNGRSVTGQAGNGESLLDEMRSAAHAAIDALLQVVPADMTLTLKEVAPVAALGQSVVLAVVELRRGHQFQTLLGVCPLSLNVVRDAALAVLDATNRVIGSV